MKGNDFRQVPKCTRFKKVFQGDFFSFRLAPSIKGNGNGFRSPIRFAVNSSLPGSFFFVNKLSLSYNKEFHDFDRRPSIRPVDPAVPLPPDSRVPAGRRVGGMDPESPGLAPRLVPGLPRGRRAPPRSPPDARLPPSRENPVPARPENTRPGYPMHHPSGRDPPDPRSPRFG
jgi:hypothetical protein